MSTSQNGWPALAADSPLLVTWHIPTKDGEVTLLLRNGSAGFILAHMVSFLADQVEPVFGARLLDDWGYAYRSVRGYTTELSNHASGTAADVNSTKHPLGKRGTWSVRQARIIRARLLWRRYRGAIAWGGNWHHRVDEMHFELAKDLAHCEQVAKRLLKTRRGKKLIAANPGQRAVIYS